MTTRNRDLDVVVVGAGFAGLYMLHRLRGLGFSTTVLESADDVGGTWYWNRYPGARCDIESIDYSYSFDPELETEWQWSERYATQPEILRYLRHVADKHDLRRDIRFSTRVESAHVGRRRASRWRVRTDRGDELRCRFFVMATGCLSLPKTPDIAGVDRFRGETYYTSRWPHAGVDFSGKRVAVIGTGSSGDPVDPDHRPAGGRAHRVPAHAELLAARPERAGRRPRRRRRFDADPAAYREAARLVDRPACRVSGRPCERSQVSEAERLAKYEDGVRVGRPPRARRHLRRHRRQPRGERDRVRVPARQDPLDRARSRDGRGALPEGPLLRHQAPVHRHQLLRDLQSAARPPGRPAQGPDPDDHRDGHRHGVALVRVRRHRLRHGLRRHDRRDRRGRHRGARRPGARRQVGRRSRAPISG